MVKGPALSQACPQGINCTKLLNELKNSKHFALVHNPPNPPSSKA